MKKEDPETYRKMLEPHADVQALNAALASFNADVRAARVKHRIADVVMICEGIYMNDGTDRRAGATVTIGEECRALGMTAWAFGQFNQDKTEHVRDMMRRNS